MKLLLIAALLAAAVLIWRPSIRRDEIRNAREEVRRVKIVAAREAQTARKEVIQFSNQARDEARKDAAHLRKDARRLRDKVSHSWNEAGQERH